MTLRDTELTKLADEVVAEKMAAVDAVMQDLVEPLEAVGNPEKLIGKKYEDWTPLDMQLLTTVYGTGNDTPLAKLAIDKEYAKLLALEKEVK